MPFPAGGQADIVTRLVADRMSPLLGQPVLVEANPGAGGNLGTEEVIKSKPDGYTWLVSGRAADHRAGDVPDQSRRSTR